ncbi:hypothetical protein D2E26_0468 [Bifidobacterium dolichotidis]|uniref:Uncharacterized protein n=2 Tax=Bifidobacterium dolichotidis TaxID=2306976 RepID=A0A430FSS3_9BIFI|nr:hypothetical protein D2E26_0468 [Bifidobacterium dolichotidis]
MKPRMKKVLATVVIAALYAIVVFVTHANVLAVVIASCITGFVGQIVYTIIDRNATKTDD